MSHKTLPDEIYVAYTVAINDTRAKKFGGGQEPPLDPPLPVTASTSDCSSRGSSKTDTSGIVHKN